MIFTETVYSFFVNCLKCEWDDVFILQVVNKINFH